ncbi:MAG TPA: protein translocase subunit SecF, partial [Nitrospirae bacterium]|nr:protein translocase subunit SecF [Nitrospirota bacterium]
MIELIRNTKIDFMGKRIFALVFSALMIILGIVSIVQISRGKANLGIDFAGGTAVQIKFNIDIPLQDIRKTLVDGGVTEFDLQTLTSENKVLIRIKKGEQTLGGRSKKIITVLSDKYSKENIVVDSTTEIGPKVGGRLRNDAFWAV